ncbi:MAG: hypothetical protein GY896_00770, partial [Gammaproteobacteria bacterium]|nr:hypothetical protein [Gammaproteobacteria bacterium]
MSCSSRTRLATVINSTRFVTSIVVVLLTTQCIAAEIKVDDIAEFEPTNCWVEVDSKAKTDCGWLKVPEDWDNPRGQKLKLPVVIYRAIEPDSSLSPVIFLAGGPGGHPLGDNGKYMNLWRREADFGFPGRTLIVFDQRGTGLSSPKLDCLEAEDPVVWWPISKNPDVEVKVPARIYAAFAACVGN